MSETDFWVLSNKIYHNLRANLYVRSVLISKDGPIGWYKFSLIQIYVFENNDES